MKLFGDYHTHTKYSKFHHGKNTVYEMVNAAEEVGLQEIAITDHAPSHFFGIWMHNIKKLRRQIDEINKTSKVKVLMGMECNLLNKQGKSDFPKKYEKLFDCRSVGFHRIVFGSFVGIFNLSLANLFCKNKYIERNTDAYIKAIEKYNFDFITHPFQYIKINLKRLCEACEKNNTFIELNNRHFLFTENDMRTMIDETNVKFIINSDAHIISSVGKVDVSFDAVAKYNVPLDRIVNVDKIPSFKENK